MPVVWREDLSIGDAEVDNDHREIIAILNEIEIVVNETGSRRALADVLATLERTCRAHFVREEQLQIEIDYPEREGHKRAHGRFLARLNDVRDQLDAAQGAFEFEAAMAQVADALRTWFVHDLMRHDQGMKPYIEAAKAKAREAAERDRILELA